MINSIVIEPEFLQVDPAEAMEITPRLVLFEHHGRDEAMVRSATMWSPSLLSAGRALGLVYYRRCLWVPIHVQANWLYVDRLDLAPVVTWAETPMVYELVTKKPKRTVTVDLGFVAQLRN